MLVFVYGTLKSGQPNHHIIKSGSVLRFLANGRTLEKRPLVVAGKHNIPYLLDAPGHGKNVIGEVYNVDDEGLHACDQLEEHPEYYQRITIKVIMESSGNSPIDAYAYVLQNFKPELMKKKYLEFYQDEGEGHGLKYVPQTEREYHPKMDVKLDNS